MQLLNVAYIYAEVLSYNLRITTIIGLRGSTAVIVNDYCSIICMLLYLLALFVNLELLRHFFIIKAHSD